eukprot:3463619-Rhodomonas_salina.1
MITCPTHTVPPTHALAAVHLAPALLDFWAARCASESVLAPKKNTVSFREVPSLNLIADCSGVVLSRKSGSTWSEGCVPARVPELMMWSICLMVTEKAAPY